MSKNIFTLICTLTAKATDALIVVILHLHLYDTIRKDEIKWY